MSELTDEVREQSARLYFVDHSPVDEAERELVAVLRLLDAERVRADSCEKMAREANAECIKHWNRADEAQARVQRVREFARTYREGYLILAAMSADR